MALEDDPRVLPEGYGDWTKKHVRRQFTVRTNQIKGFGNERKPLEGDFLVRTNHGHVAEAIRGLHEKRSQL